MVRAHRIDPICVIGSSWPQSVGSARLMGELQYPGAPCADEDRQYRAPFRRAPQYRWPAPQGPQPSAFAPWRRAPAPPRPPDYRRSASYPGKPDEPYQVSELCKLFHVYNFLLLISILWKSNVILTLLKSEIYLFWNQIIYFQLF